jgi:hypothetical protein
MATKPKASVVRGVVAAPTKEDVRKIVAKLRRDLKGSRSITKQWKQDPRSVLGAYGLNADVQNELLRDAGVNVAALPCIFTECIHTCWFTDCVLTHIVVKKD